jgi:hypothetical protein
MTFAYLVSCWLDLTVTMLLRLGVCGDTRGGSWIAGLPECIQQVQPLQQLAEGTAKHEDEIVTSKPPQQC